MKVFISGGTGFVGSNLALKLLGRGDEVTVVSSSGRSRLPSSPSLHIVKADTSQRGDWQRDFAKYDVIVNLAGRSIFHLWTESYKKYIFSSRVQTTRNIVEALPDNSQVVLLSASAAGYYGDCGDTEQIESAPVGTDFLADVCENWENEALLARKKGVRVAVMRFGVVLGRRGGAIATMKTPYQLGLGGPIGSGGQWFPWIHLEDLLSAICFLMDGGDLEGPFNFTAPGLVRQKEFAKILAGVLGRPALLPAPSIVMRAVLGEFGKSLLQGQKVVPEALLAKGFLFSYPQLEEALQEILNG